MPQLTSRHTHLIKKALAIAILTIEHQAGELQAASDLADMKRLLPEICGSENEVRQYLRMGGVAVTNEVPGA